MDISEFEIEDWKYYWILSGSIWYVRYLPHFRTFYLIQVNEQGNDDFINLLNYLEQCNCITEEEYKGLKNDIVRDVGLNLFSLIVLFAGVDWAQDFVSSLPLDIQESADSTNPEPNFNTLIATDFASSRYVVFDGIFILS